MIPVFDGHNDSLLRLYQHCESNPGAFLEGLEERSPPVQEGTATEPQGSETSEPQQDESHPNRRRRARGQLDLPRAAAGGFQGGFFAVFVPPPRDLDLGNIGSGALPQGYDEPVPQETALRVTLEMVSVYQALVRNSAARIRPVRTTDDLELEPGTIRALLHIEGAEAIDPRLRNLEALFAAGVRSIGPVWSRPNDFGAGVPFRFPSSPDTGPGLTTSGRDLVRACRDLGIVVDLSHLNEKGFWDVAELGGGPLVATHCCAHALSPSSRNLTDDQLRAVRDSDGVVGLNFHVGDLRASGGITREQPVSRMVEHLVHMAEVMGVRHVALGSDFDGALMPLEIADASDLQKLPEALLDVGLSRAEVDQIAHANWLRVLDHCLPSP